MQYLWWITKEQQQQQEKKTVYVWGQVCWLLYALTNVDVNAVGTFWPRAFEQTSSSNILVCMHTTEEVVSAVISACGPSCLETWVCLETFGVRYADTCTGSYLCQGKHLCIWMVWGWRRCKNKCLLAEYNRGLSSCACSPGCAWAKATPGSGTMSLFRNEAKAGKKERKRG